MMDAGLGHINGATRVYGIIGNPVAHSLSPVMHNAAFGACGHNRVYIPLPVTDICAGLAGFKAFGLDGASVTIPHKEAVLLLCDEVEPVAERIGAINTLQAVRTGDSLKVCGHNTDWLGANRALLHKTELSGKGVVLLGAGGSARAIGFGLLEAGASVVLCSRTENRGKSLAADLGCSWRPLTELPALHGDILVNATSVGMVPDDDRSLLEGDPLAAYAVVMDIVYAPLQTRLLQQAAALGCSTVNGLEMLLYQGVAQFELWTGEKAPVGVMRQALLEATGHTS